MIDLDKLPWDYRTGVGWCWGIWEVDRRSVNLARISDHSGTRYYLYDNRRHNNKHTIDEYIRMDAITTLSVLYKLQEELGEPECLKLLKQQNSSSTSVETPTATTPSTLA